ncbi:MAG: Ig-like domain-containing protein [Tannerellaceae bacterium]|jgi:hypothetical protein|nr:Ig-like domain-containing protein [Tannerellaceae bacterium]
MKRTGMFLVFSIALLCASCGKDDEDNSIALQSITIEQGTSVELGTGQSLQLTLVRTPANATVNEEAVWHTSNETVATVGRSSGLVNAAGAGNATISATLDGKTTDLAITVTETLVKQVIDLGDGSNNYEIKGDLTLSYPNTYILKGFVYVAAGATLTIEPGVIVKGDKASKGTLIVERGGEIIAQGTKELPIVFTSSQAPGNRKPGDWGGLILLGNAPNNMGEQTIEGGVRSKHGGMNANDNSGILSYLRVEFAGIEYSTDNEINGITFGSVGAGTTLDHLQVSYSGDDSFEWFGGTVNATHLVAYHGWDDDFDTDNGFSGKIQFALCIRDPETGDKSASNGFESDNNANGSTSEPYTSAVFTNVSLFGPVTDPASYTDRAGVKGSPVDARFQAALHLRRNTQLSIFNSLVAAFPIGLIIEDNGRGTAQTWATEGKLNVANCILAGPIKNFQDAQFWRNNSPFDANDPGTFADTYFYRAEGGNQTFATLAELKLSGSPQVFPASDSPLASGAAWTHAKVSSGFSPVTYIGAFGPSETPADNWMAGWCNFDPQNTVY